VSDRPISPETALRLAQYFGNSAQVWMNLQTRYGLIVAEQEQGKRIRAEVDYAAWWIEQIREASCVY
jgi:plasmid maintenance system antidote protein VapI